MSEREIERLRRILKRSPEAVRVVRAGRAAAARLRRGPARILRGSRIEAYIRSHPVRLLQIGAGANQLPGWLNTDAYPGSLGDVFLDARERFPIPDATFDFIFSEHQIEHVGWTEGRHMLRECRRVLKPGGTLRVATPDLDVILALRTPSPSPVQLRYVRWIVDEYLPHAGCYDPLLVVNNAFRNWGHQFLYDESALRRALEEAGFDAIVRRAVGESDHAELRGVESHGESVGDVEMNRFETLVLEGSRKTEGD